MIFVRWLLALFLECVALPLTIAIRADMLERETAERRRQMDDELDLLANDDPGVDVDDPRWS